MSKMILAQEEWDDRLGFHRPCGISPNWNTDQGRIQVPYTLGEYLTKDLTKKGVETLKAFINREYVNAEYVGKNELNGKKYFYVINIYEPNFFLFNGNYGFIHVGTNTLEDVRNDMCKIILVQDVEGMSGMKNSHHESEFILIDKWCDSVNIPYKNVYYITGNLKGTEIAKQQNVKSNIISITTQETWNNVLNFGEDVVDFKPVDEKYLFLNYSRRPRFHRTFLLLKLFKENLQDSGLWSFNSLSSEPQTSELLKLDKDVEPYISYLYENSPFLIDIDNFNDNITVHVPLKDYEQTFINIAGETLSDESILFISEKTWKPMIVGSPFIINGNPGTLKYLKNEGFLTFNKWIDESYDDEPNLNVRLDKIVNELKKIKSKSIEELIEIRNEMKPICQYNKNLMIERTKKKFYTKEGLYFHSKPTSDVLQKIWDEWNPEHLIVEEPIIIQEPIVEIIIPEPIVEKTKKRLI